MIYLHIGTHKTGSTSIQEFLSDGREHLASLGYSLYRGCQANEKNHAELHLATMREGRDSLGRLRWPEFQGREYRDRIASRVKTFLCTRSTPHAIFSNEALSYLRYADEVDRLAEMMEADGDNVTVILYLRNKSDFLRSYTQQIFRLPGRRPVADRASVLYVGPDSWLVDYDSLLEVYSERFGANNVVAIDYDHECSQQGTVLVSFQRALALKPEHQCDRSAYYLNQTKHRCA